MSQLRQALDDYLAIRRQLGFKLEIDGRLLERSLSRSLNRSGRADHDAARVAWAAASRGQAAPVQSAARDGPQVRSVPRDARPGHRDPADRLLPACQQRIAPYIYSAGEIDALMSALQPASPPVRAATSGR